jgi:hypothetical protein
LSKKPDISTSKSRVTVSALAGFVPLLGWDCSYLIHLEQADNYAPPCCKQQGIRIGDLMKLTEVRDSNRNIAINDFDSELTKEIQQRLSIAGCLDPPADGVFGQVSRLVLRKFADKLGIDIDDILNAELASALLNNDADSLFPLTLGNDLASRIIKYMQARNFWFARMKGMLTIVYIEGVDEDGTSNADTFNEFNDRRIVLTLEDGKPKILHNVLATTEPGRFFTMNPTNPKGAARIAFGQFKAWNVGVHKAGKPSAHEALVQVADLPVHRDTNKDGKRNDGPVDTGIFGINQHKGFNAAITNIGQSSAGCLVSRSNDDHLKFMALVKTDTRYIDASRGYRFMSTIIAGDDFNS